MTRMEELDEWIQGPSERDLAAADRVRTCTIVSIRETDDMWCFEYELSCGHKVEWPWDAPNFCPWCGLKVTRRLPDVPSVAASDYKAI